MDGLCTNRELTAATTNTKPRPRPPMSCEAAKISPIMGLEISVAVSSITAMRVNSRPYAFASMDDTASPWIVGSKPLASPRIKVPNRVSW
jgi:hypothetical protein